MYFVNRNILKGKGIRSCSFVLAMLIMFSMLFVGQVGTIEASAVTTFTSGKTIYLDLTSFTSFEEAGARFYAWIWYSGGSKTQEFKSCGDDVYSITLDGSATGLTFIRNNDAVSDGTSVWPSGWDSAWYKKDFSFEENSNCIKVTSWSENSWTVYTPPVDYVAGETYYVDLSAVSSSWDVDNSEIVAYCWGSNCASVYATLMAVNGESNIYKFTAPDGATGCTIMKLNDGYGYDSVDTVKNGIWPFFDYATTKIQTEDVTFSSANKLIEVDSHTNNETGKYQVQTTTYNGNGDVSANSYTVAANNYGYKNPDGTYTNDDNGVTLLPVAAQFYDYMTDYELQNGWLSNESLDYYASRLYTNRVPFKAFNSYISDQVASLSTRGIDWTYPLYFGNLFYGNANKTDIADKKKNLYAASSVLYKTLRGTYTDAGDSKEFDYLGGRTLLNFSLYANDSSPVYDITGTYRGSILGVVYNRFASDSSTLSIGTDNLSAALPYFSDQTVTDGYATKVTTTFPMRVNPNNSTTKSVKNEDESVTTVSTTYTTYEFNSGTNDEGSYNDNDNVWFTYDENDDGSISDVAQINYGKGLNYHSYDAYGDLGGNGYNHPGFFPFDSSRNNSSSNFAYDYGFGMRLDVPFYFTGDGKALDLNGDPTDANMKFIFEGDDDVWVFIDGKLVLELSGDHGNAHGEIDFADKQISISTGMAEFQSDHTLKALAQDTSVGGDTYTKDFSGIFTTEGDNPDIVGESYNANKLHTMTVFYMERGEVESNLYMSFSIGAVPSNSLSLSKQLDTSDVNTALASYVKDLVIVNDTFDFSFAEKDSSGNKILNSYTYTLEDADGNKKSGTLENTATENGKVTIPGGNTITFNDQFSNDSSVIVAEVTKGKYEYDQTLKVTDVSDGTSTDADYPTENGYTVDLKTANPGSSANIFEVTFKNTVQTAANGLTLKKEAYEADGTTLQDINAEFEFEIKIQLPGETEATARSFTYTKNETTYTAGTDGKVKLKKDETITIPGLPVNTVVNITETADSKYSTGYSDSDGNGNGNSYTVTISDTTTVHNVVCTNTKIWEKTSAAISATKWVDSQSYENNGFVASTAPIFSFTIQEYVVDNDGNPTTEKIGTAKTVQNNTTGSITFDTVNYGTESENYYTAPGTHWYKFTEETTQSGNNDEDKYNIDATIWWVKVEVERDTTAAVYSTLKATAKYYKNKDGVPDLSEYTSITFKNTSKSGSVIVKKTAGDITTGDRGLDGATIALVEAVNNGTENSPKWEPKTGATAVNVQTATVDNVKGIAKFDNVPTGDYVVYETVAPAGYELDGTYHYVQVTAGGTATVTSPSVTIEDKKSTELPKTGGMGIALFVIVGVVLVLAGIILLKPKKDKTNK